MQTVQFPLKLRMQTTISSASSGKPRPLWLGEEIAFVLNFSDFCLKDKKDYRSLVTAELSKFANRNITTTAIKSKMEKTLATCCSAKYSDLVKNGTQSLDLSKLPSQILNFMKQQRTLWGLDELSTPGDSEGSATQGSEDAVSRTMVVSERDHRRADSS
jgi:hypothetical protein